MENQRTLVLQGYDRAVAKIKAIHKERTGHEYGALVWLGRELGVTRQTIENWSKRSGFPLEYVARVAELTGLRAEAVRPDTVLIDIPKKSWRAMSAASPEHAKQASIIPYNSRRKHG